MEDTKLQLLPDTGLSRLKWEQERERTGFSDLIGLGTADMDYRCPEPVLAALHRLLDMGHLGYPMIPDAYYDAIHDWLLRTTLWDIDARSCVINSVGIYASAWNLIQLLTKPGDKIVTLTPVHFCFRNMINLNGRFNIECPLILKEGNYIIDYAGLEACLASGSRMLWLCNPHNPVGRAWRREELQTVADLCEKYHVYIMSDDVYCGLTFPGIPYTPIASLSKKVSYQTVTLYSTSKTYNTTGLRHSFILTENPEIAKRYSESLMRMSLSYGQNIMGLEAVLAAYNECGGWLDALKKQIQSNHRFLSEFVSEQLPGASVTHSEATYFAWLDLRRLRLNPRQIAYLLEQEEHMIVENGAEDGKGGEGFIRMNLATSEANLEQGAARLRHFWSKHQK